MKTGVGLILIARDTRRILVLRELRNKPEIEKLAGMVSFPLETMEEGEDKGQVVRRLVDEEIGIKISEEPVFFGGDFFIVRNARTLAAYAFCDAEFVPRPSDGDVQFYGWLYPDELACSEIFIRKEVGPIIQSFLSLNL